MRHDPIDPGQPTDREEIRPVIRVRDYMTHPAVTVGWEEPVAVAWSLMQTKNIRHLPVIDPEGHLVGVVTEANLREVIAGLPSGEGEPDLAGAPPTLIVGKVMTWRTDAVHPDSEITAAARLMQDRKIDALPVVEGDQVVGILTDIDIMRAFCRFLGQWNAPGARPGRFRRA